MRSLAEGAWAVLAAAVVNGGSANAAAPPTARTEHFDDPVIAARFLRDGRARFATTHRVVIMSSDGSRSNIAPADCAPMARAVFSDDGEWVVLACNKPSSSGVWRTDDPKRVAALAIGRDDAPVFCGDTLQIGAARLRVGTWSTYDKAAGCPSPGEAQVGGASVRIEGKKLVTRPYPLGDVEADGFALTPDDHHLWVWRNKEAVRLVWTPAMALRPKLGPAAPILLSRPVQVTDGGGGTFARFQEKELDAVALFVPSGDDLYCFLLVLSDRRGGAERVDAETCALTARHWNKRIDTSGALVKPDACVKKRREVVRLTGPAATDSGVTFKQASVGHQRVTLAMMSAYGEETELWLWRYDANKGDFDAATWGAPPVLQLPGEE